jgi:hypothetical protein
MCRAFDVSTVARPELRFWNQVGGAVHTQSLIANEMEFLAFTKAPSAAFEEVIEGASGLTSSHKMSLVRISDDRIRRPTSVLPAEVQK